MTFVASWDGRGLQEGEGWCARGRGAAANVENCRDEREEAVAGSMVTEAVYRAFVIGRIAIILAARGRWTLARRLRRGRQWAASRQRKSTAMVLALQCSKMAVAGFAFVQPNEDAAAFRERAEIDLTVVIDVGGNDRNDAVVGSEDLRDAARDAHLDTGLGWARQDDAIEDPITIEVRIDGGVGRRRQQTHRGRRGQSTTDETSERSGDCLQWFSRNLTSPIVSGTQAGSTLLDSLSFGIAGINFQLAFAPFQLRAQYLEIAAR
jgi:hypothetical protein